MDTNRLEDAEAIYNLVDDLAEMDLTTRRLHDAAGRLTHTVRHFAVAYLAGGAPDPRHLLLELGALVELCRAVDLVRLGIGDNLDALGFAFAPKPNPTQPLQDRALDALRLRMAIRGVPTRRRRRPVGGPGVGG